MEHKVKLGIAVKAARQKLGLTQIELADRVGVSLRTITDWKHIRQIRNLIPYIRLSAI